MEEHGSGGGRLWTPAAGWDSAGLPGGLSPVPLQTGHPVQGPMLLMQPLPVLWEAAIAAGRLAVVGQIQSTARGESRAAAAWQGLA